MSSWRDQILKEFTPKVARLTLVADPDGLLLGDGAEPIGDAHSDADDAGFHP